MGIGRAYRIAGTMTALIIVAGCSASPRFAGPSRPAEPAAPEVARAPAGGGTGGETPRFGSPRDTSGATADPSADSLGDAIVRRAADYLGTPYRNGGTTSHGLDCSGLTFTVYRSFGIELPRSSREQARVGDPVPHDQLAVGDLVFFGNGSRSISHVGIYAGDGEFIHASNRARSVRFDRLDNKYFRNRYVTARRVL
jgi:cell wall-associated NlpC family hydrolase